MAKTTELSKNITGGTVTVYYKGDSLPVKVNDSVTFKGISGKVTASGPMPGSKNWYITITF